MRLSQTCESKLKLRDAEELEVLLFEEGHSMPNALGEDCLEVRTKRRVRVARREERLGHIRERRARVPEDSRPLLDLLEEVLRVERGVTIKVQSSQTLKQWRKGMNTYAVPCQTCILG